MVDILVQSRIDQLGLDLLASRPEFSFEVLEDPSEEAIIKAGQGARAMSVRNAIISRRVIESIPTLKIISRHGVGYDNVDMQAANEHGIVVAITTQANASSVVEHTLAFMLSLAKNVRHYDEQTRSGNFAVRLTVDASDLGGRSILILGVGRIGSQLVPVCKAFGMNVFAHDPVVSDDAIKAMGATPVADWRASLAEYDWVTVHCPRNEETIGLLSTDELAAMKPSAFVINCARGGIIDEKALHQALSTNSIKGAAIDVFDDEPTPADHPLFSLDNIIVSPHSAAATVQGMQRMGHDTAANILAFLDGKLDPTTTVNPQVLTA